MRRLLIAMALMATVIAMCLPVCTAADDVTLGPPQIGEWDPIEMPDPHKPPALTDDTSTESSTRDNLFLPILLGLVLVINIIAILVILIDKKSKTSSSSGPTKATHCPTCGNALPDGSAYCWSCGSEAKRP